MGLIAAFPARAGMNRHFTAFIRRAYGVPRTRGDETADIRSNRSPPGVPRTRGDEPTRGVVPR